MILSSGASTGGTDIVGLALAKKNNHFSVGKLGLVVNIFIYNNCRIKIWNIYNDLFNNFICSR